MEVVAPTPLTENRFVPMLRPKLVLLKASCGSFMVVFELWGLLGPPLVGDRYGRSTGCPHVASKTGPKPPQEKNKQAQNQPKNDPRRPKTQQDVTNSCPHGEKMIPVGFESDCNWDP